MYYYLYYEAVQVILIHINGTNTLFTI